MTNRLRQDCLLYLVLEFAGRMEGEGELEPQTGRYSEAENVVWSQTSLSEKKKHI